MKKPVHLLAGKTGGGEEFDDQRRCLDGIGQYRFGDGRGVIRDLMRACRAAIGSAGCYPKL